MSPQDWRERFERLVGRFALLSQALAPLQAHPRGDSRREALASAGFSEAVPQGQWSAAHRDEVLDLLADDYSAESLEWYEEQAEPVADFAAFFLGYIIGLHEAGGLTERDRMLGEMLLPGLMLEDLGRIMNAAQGHVSNREHP